MKSSVLFCLFVLSIRSDYVCISLNLFSEIPYFWNPAIPWVIQPPQIRKWQNILSLVSTPQDMRGVKNWPKEEICSIWNSFSYWEYSVHVRFYFSEIMHCKHLQAFIWFCNHDCFWTYSSMFCYFLNFILYLSTLLQSIWCLPLRY